MKNDQANPVLGTEDPLTMAEGGAMPPRMPTILTAPAQDSSRRRRWWHRKWGWEVLLLIYAGYDGSRLLVSGSLRQAQQHGQDLLSFEKHVMHFSPERAINHAFSAHAWLGIPGDFIYASLHYVVTLSVLVWIWRSRQEHYRQARTWLMLTTLLGVVGFVLFPTAPPRLLDSSYGYIDLLAQHASVGWWGAGGGGTPKGFEGMSNEFAAMPSLHVGWALWGGLLIFRHARRRVLRVLGLLYPVMIAIVVMGTANHYLLDCLVGAGVTLVSLAATGPLLRLSDRTIPRVRRRLAAVRGRR
jgi:hypothetical protein